MAVPVLISASAVDWKLLNEASGLPEGLFCEHPDSETDPTLIPFISCGDIQRDPDIETTEDLERIDEILFSCKNGHFIHLHRCCGTAEDEIKRIKVVSASWARISKQRKRRYESYIRPSMIIVGGDSTLGGETDFRRMLELIEKERDALVFRDYYLMTPRLEPSGREIFHARTVWPISVGRLFLFLSSVPPGNAAGNIYGWRFTEFRQTAPDLLYQILVPACADDLLGRLRLGDGQDPGLPDWLPISSVTQWEKHEPKRPAAWDFFDALGESEKMIDPLLMKGRFREWSGIDRANRTNEIVKQWRMREDDLARFWGELKREPSAAWRGESLLKVATKPDLAALAAKSDSDALQFMQRVRAVYMAAQLLRSSSRELREAQTCFLQRPWRFAIAVCAASFLGILFFRGAQVNFGNPAMAAVIAAACFVGSFAAVGLAFLLENLRGEKGAREWHERSRGFEQSVADLNGHMAAWNNDAAAVFAATGRSVGESKLARLIQRITNAVTVAFSSKSLPAASSREETSKSLRYLERCSVKFGKQGEQSIVESREDMTKHAVKRMQEECPEFLQKIRELWSEIARLSDPVAVGAFSVTKLRSALSNHLSTLPGTIDRLLCYSTDPQEAFASIKEQAAKISSHGGHELLSVEVADGVNHDFRSHLLVSPEFLQGDEGDVYRLPQGAASVSPFLLLELAVIESGQLASPGKIMEVTP